jgi:hypothetical protein
VKSAILEFLAVGGSMLLALPLVYVLKYVFGVSQAELGIGFVTFYAANLINNPHFAVTYLLFYRDVARRALGAEYSVSQRLRYWFAGFLVPLVLGVVLFFAAWLRLPRVLGISIQVMLFLVGWHYVKQGYGVLSVLSARAGVLLSGVERRWFLFHAVAGWLFARTNPRDAGRVLESDGVVFTTVAHPVGLSFLTLLTFAVSAVGVGWCLLAMLRQRRQLPPLAALSGYLVSIWLWTAFSRWEPLMAYLIPALHGIQYGFFVLTLRRRQAQLQSSEPPFRPVSAALALTFFCAALLGWVFFRGAPPLLDALWSNPRELGDIGPTPFLAALTTFVNLHHYFMDSVIWRRENPETALLIAPAT